MVGNTFFFYLILIRIKIVFPTIYEKKEKKGFIYILLYLFGDCCVGCGTYYI
jgi:hypothetical protein